MGSPAWASVDCLALLQAEWSLSLWFIVTFVCVWGEGRNLLPRVNLARGPDTVMPSLPLLAHSSSDPGICLFQLLCSTPDPSPEFHPWLQPFPHNWTGREWP